MSSSQQFNGSPHPIPLTLQVPHHVTISPVDTIPSICGLPLKYVSLVTLAVQNALLTIIMHYSRVSTSPSEAYSAASAVLLNELLKCSISLIIAFSRIESSQVYQPYHPGTPKKGFYFHQTSSSDSDPSFITTLFRHGSTRTRKLAIEVFSHDCWKLSIPAILYVIQNNLQFVAASNLDVATFQVTYQMKILTTAGFSVLLLRKKLSSAKWVALLFLAIGVGIVQIQAGSSKSSASEHHMRPLLGFLAVSSACFTSGLAGVYFEMVLKTSKTDLWIRNIQLSLFSLIPALVPILFSPDSEGNGWLIFNIFHNFGFWAWATVLVQVFGGLITAVVIKYSDNILKGFATSLSIVISSLAGVALFAYTITPGFILGSTTVLAATWLYNQPDKKPVGARRGSVRNQYAGSSYPGSPVDDDEPILGLQQQRRTSSSSSLLSPIGLSSSSSSLADTTFGGGGGHSHSNGFLGVGDSHYLATGPYPRDSPPRSPTVSTLPSRAVPNGSPLSSGTSPYASGIGSPYASVNVTPYASGTGTPLNEGGLSRSASIIGSGNMGSDEHR